MQRRRFLRLRPLALPALLLAGFLVLNPAPTAAAANVNIVGYVNVTLPPGFKLIANQLSNGANRVEELFPIGGVPDATQLIKFDGRDWVTNEWWAGAWTYPDMTLSPGEAALVNSPVEWLQTFVGEVPIGELRVFVPAGLSWRSSMVPQAGPLSTRLGFPLVAGTKVFRVDASGTPILRATATADGWDPAEPSLDVGEGIYIEAPEAFVWSRRFNVEGEPPPPVEFATQPQSQQVKPGDTLTLTAQPVLPAGASVKYQWQLNGNDILGATEPTLTIPNARAETVGSYWVRVLVGAAWTASELATIELATGELPRLAIQHAPGASVVTLAVQQVAGRKFTWEISTDLVNWSTLAPTGSPPPPAELADSTTAAEGRRFYRVRLQ